MVRAGAKVSSQHCRTWLVYNHTDDSFRHSKENTQGHNASIVLRRSSAAHEDAPEKDIHTEDFDHREPL